MFVKTKKTRLFEDIVNQIKSLILDNTLAPGDQLPSETELATQFGVSRVTIREAIRILEISGMLETYRGKGTIVTAVTSKAAKKRFSLFSLCLTKDLSNLLEVREIIEPEVAAQAAKDATEQQVNRMESALAKMIRDIDQGGPGVEGALKFHHEIIKSIKNDILSNLMDSIMTMIERSTHITLNLPNRPRISYQEHLEILNAIREHDEEKARCAMRAHLREVRNKLGSPDA